MPGGEVAGRWAVAAVRPVYPPALLAAAPTQRPPSGVPLLSEVRREFMTSYIAL